MSEIGLVLSCEHASFAVPPGVELGVRTEILRSQASWDHGAHDIALAVADALGIHLHAGLFSRMFVDLNRGPTHADVIPRISYGEVVPGNHELDERARMERIEMFHAPYWSAVRRDCEARLLDRGRVFHFSSHTFSPALDPTTRTFDVGVLYDPSHAFEAEIAERLLFALRGAGFDVRANQPYGGTGPAICTEFRTLFGAPYAGIQLETSHAVTETPGGCARVAAAVLPFLESLAED